jgi:hypothetical protein
MKETELYVVVVFDDDGGEMCVLRNDKFRAI